MYAFQVSFFQLALLCEDVNGGNVKTIFAGQLENQI